MHNFQKPFRIGVFVNSCLKIFIGKIKVTKFVYDTVKKAEKLAKLENVDEFEAKTRAEIEAKVRAELEAKFEAKAKAESEKAASLSPSLANQRAAGGNTGVVSIADPLETTFNR